MSAENAEPKATRWWLLPLLLACVMAGLIASRLRSDAAVQRSPGRQEDVIGWKPSAPVNGQSVSLVIDFGNGAERSFESLSWQSGLTVQGLLEAATQFRPGITFAFVGEGKSAFLTHIDGLVNDGAGGRHWQFWINEKRADRSFAVCELEAGDRVLWRFASAE